MVVEQSTCIDSPVVLTFKNSENVAIVSTYTEFEQLLIATRGAAYVIIGSKFIPFVSVNTFSRLGT